jgi:hypothetical protein
VRLAAPRRWNYYAQAASGAPDAIRRSSSRSSVSGRSRCSLAVLAERHEVLERGARRCHDRARSGQPLREQRAQHTEQGLRFLDDIGASNAALHLDTHHMNIEEQEMAAAIELAGDRMWREAWDDGMELAVSARRVVLEQLAATA